jgi:hypothetical protein
MGRSRAIWLDFLSSMTKKLRARPMCACIHRERR